MALLGAWYAAAAWDGMAPARLPQNARRCSQAGRGSSPGPSLRDPKRCRVPLCCYGAMSRVSGRAGAAERGTRFTGDTERGATTVQKPPRATIRLVESMRPPKRDYCEACLPPIQGCGCPLPREGLGPPCCCCLLGGRIALLLALHHAGFCPALQQPGETLVRAAGRLALPLSI